MHIIFIITFAPKYEFVGENVPTPVHSWKNPKGEDVSIWNEDWGIIFGKKMLEQYPEMTFEVLRGDFRADKRYDYEFDCGLLYKSFPAENIMLKDGIKKHSYIYSSVMESYIQRIVKEKNDDTVLLIPAERTAYTVLFTEKFKSELPIIHFHFTNNRGLFKKIEFTFNPVKLIHRYLVRRQRKALNKKIEFLQVVHKEGVQASDDFKDTEMCIVSFGIETDYWTAVESREEAKKRLGLGNEKMILFSSRLIKPYQIVEAIEVLSKFKDKQFTAIFTSYGDEDYVNEIKQKIKDTGMGNHIRLVGYVSREEMRTYFTACDVFMMTSIVNAGPASTYKAIVMKRPVITTDSGRASEILKEYNAGYIVPPKDYLAWEKSVEDFLNDKEIPIIEDDIMDEFSWEGSLRRWHELFEHAIHKFSKNKI